MTPMLITECEIAHRKNLLLLNEQDLNMLASYHAYIESQIDALVDRFYTLQTGITEMALRAGDADMLTRLRATQRRYILDLFSGQLDLAYVNHRLRIGLVHKQLGVEPKLYLSAVNTLKGLLVENIFSQLPHEPDRIATLHALEKLFIFDMTLVFETYIGSLVSDVESSRDKTEKYANALEKRTQELEALSRTDALTGLLSARYLQETLMRSLRSCQCRAEPLVVVYLDIDNFKQINDTHGHLRGDEVLRIVGSCISKCSRMEDWCFRYGGDEFCLILPNCNEEDAKEVYLKRLTHLLAEHLEDVTLSIGLVQTGPLQFDEGNNLIRLADERMYAEKKARKPLQG